MKKSIKIALFSFILLIVGAVVYFIVEKQGLFVKNDKYVGRGEECSFINYVCEPGTKEFYDGVGCGCK